MKLEGGEYTADVIEKTEGGEKGRERGGVGSEMVVCGVVENRR